MKQYTNYSELLLDVENSENFSTVLCCENEFSVVYDSENWRYFYIEEGENDADVFFEVEEAAKLVTDYDAHVTDSDLAALQGLFGSICSGAIFDYVTNQMTYLWFTKIEDQEAP